MHTEENRLLNQTIAEPLVDAETGEILLRIRLLLRVPRGPHHGNGSLQGRLLPARLASSLRKERHLVGTRSHDEVRGGPVGGGGFVEGFLGDPQASVRGDRPPDFPK